MKMIEGGVCAPKGFKAAGAHAGLKKRKKDMALVLSEAPCATAGAYTTNKVKAAPVLYDKAITDAGAKTRAVIVNAGNANACTGERGKADCQATAELTAKELGLRPDEVLVASTGVIGVPLDMAKIEKGIKLLSPKLSEEGWKDASEAIMTTDTWAKTAAAEVEVGGVTVRIGGMSKGSGMIHPNMATTLSFITTDANIEPGYLKKLLGETVDDTYNMVSVDGDTSTNDTVLVMANGLSGCAEITGGAPESEIFAEAFDAVLGSLARDLARDGEGASRFITCRVEGAKTKEDAKTLARSVVSSSLVKAAFFGADANWGRILCAMGYSGADFDPELVDLKFTSPTGEIPVLEKGTPLPFSEEEAKALLLGKEVGCVADCNQGAFSAEAWGCDLTYDYVKINGDYRS